MVTDTIGFRPNATDRRIIEKFGESPTDTIRYALRLLDHELWLEQFHREAREDKDWDPNEEPDAW